MGAWNVPISRLTANPPFSKGEVHLPPSGSHPPFAKGGMGRISSSLHHRNLLLRQPVQLVHQPVDLPVGGIDLSLDEGRVVAGPGFRQLLIEGEHLLGELHHPVVAGLVEIV